jgi:hypothetical protein
MGVYIAELRPGGLQGARIGVARNLAEFHPGVDAVFERSLATLAAAARCSSILPTWRRIHQHSLRCQALELPRESTGTFGTEIKGTPSTSAQ